MNDLVEGKDGGGSAQRVDKTAAGMHLRPHSILGTFLLAVLVAQVLSAADSSQKCRLCHTTETDRFLNSPMGESIRAGESLPSGMIHHSLSGSTLTIQSRGATMQHTVRRGGASASYPVAYSVGAGEVGFSFLIRIGEYLFQSPASYYSREKKWDLTPGYEGERLLDFTHEITSGCLFCHAGAVKLAARSQDRFIEPALTPISCERCHGPSEAHLQNPKAGTILNPAKLSPKVRDSVCEQCHLEGATRVLNPGREWFDFHPGDLLESVFATYVRTGGGTAGPNPPAVSQVEQLAQSACARASGDKLWCGSCHDPHGPDQARSTRVRNVCLGCHAASLTKVHPEPAGDCVSCHMPKLRPGDVAHAAITDHRIPRRIESAKNKKGGGVNELVAWRDPDKTIALRDLGLAYFETAAEDKDNGELGRGYDLLSHLAPAQLHRDPETLFALGSILLEQRQVKLADKFLSEAVKLKPENPRYTYTWGVALEAKGDFTAAIMELRRSIGLDPSRPDPYLKLAEIYQRTGSEDLRKSVLREYLRFMPQNLLMRSE